MANYDNAANMGRQIIFKFIKDRMKDQGVTQLQLADMIGINESTLIRNFKNDTQMSLETFLKICGALEINPYLVPKEDDKMKKDYLNFN